MSGRARWWNDAARLRTALSGHPGENGGPVAPARRRGGTEWHKAPPCASERSSDVIMLGPGIGGDGALVMSELRSDGQGGALSHWKHLTRTEAPRWDRSWWRAAPECRSPATPPRSAPAGWRRTSPHR